jgi:hypothetical protein
MLLLPRLLPSHTSGGRPLALAFDPSEPAYVHEESGEVTKRVYAKALEAKNHVVLDGTGDNSLESLKKKLDQARATGPGTRRTAGCRFTSCRRRARRCGCTTASGGGSS